MELVEPSPDWVALLARHRAEVEAQLRASDLPLVGLAEPAPEPRMLGDTMAIDGTIRSVGLSYGDPTRADGPLVHVRTVREDPPDLWDAIEEEQDRVGDEAIVDEVPSTGVLTVDGEPCAAEVIQAPPRFWAGRCAYRGVQIVVVARDWELATARLAAVPDVGPFVQGSQDHLRRLRAAGPPPRPEPAEVAHPHRALVDAVLQQSRDIQLRVRAGRRPRIRQDPDGPLARMPGLWEAATRAQMRFAEQDRRAANAAVTALVNQLVALQEQATWFTIDAGLREAAIAETLQFWTRLRETVSSRAAQEAWREVWPVGDRLRTDWLAAWTDWAGERGYRG
jgi:hypothetical protein